MHINIVVRSTCTTIVICMHRWWWLYYICLLVLPSYCTRNEIVLLPAKCKPVSIMRAMYLLSIFTSNTYTLYIRYYRMVQRRNYMHPCIGKYVCHFRRFPPFRRVKSLCSKIRVMCIWRYKFTYSLCDVC